MAAWRVGEPFELLQTVSWAPYASLTPTGRVDAVLVAAYQLPIEQTDKEERRLMLKGAVVNGPRGFMVSSGQYSAANFAQFLCFVLPPLMQTICLPCVAGGVVKVFSDAAAAAAERNEGIFVVSPAASRARGATVGRGSGAAPGRRPGATAGGFP